jgi:hypothetical protein
MWLLVAQVVQVAADQVPAHKARVGLARQIRVAVEEADMPFLSTKLAALAVAALPS